MALFRLKEFDKEGDGVSKDAPKKRGFFAFFENYFLNFWKFVTANCWLVLLSIPLITCGLANVGATHIARSFATRQHSFGTSDFFGCIKKNLKQGLFAGIINIIITVILIASTRIYAEAMMASKNIVSMETVCFGIVLFMLIIFSMMKFYIWTLIITFKYKLGQVYSNSFKLALIGIKRNLLIFVCLLPCYALLGALIIFFGNIGFVIALFLTVSIFPMFRLLVIEQNIFPVIKKILIDPYYEKHPDEDIEKRRNLGLEVPKEENDDNVFTDTI